MVLVMTVEPGFGGQKFMENCLEKVTEIRALSPTIYIEVDGGVNEQTGKELMEAGADVLVAGSFVFCAPDMAEAVHKLKNM